MLTVGQKLIEVGKITLSTNTPKRKSSVTSVAELLLFNLSWH
ncbi:hypothetical protein THF1C08_60162 [Vibrio jasicida]|nr:hypothetical protein THF1C08_60162 [Vibrio jasicida]